MSYRCYRNFSFDSHDQVHRRRMTVASCNVVQPLATLALPMKTEINSRARGDV